MPANNEFFDIRMEGVADMVRALKGAPEKIRKQAVRNALRKAATVIKADAKRKLRATSSNANWPHRISGTVLRRISVRTSKYASRAGDEGMFIGVKPLRGKADTRKYGKAARNNPNDPFYWKFLEFKTKNANSGTRPFLGPAAKSSTGHAVTVFFREVLPAMERIDRQNEAKAKR